jgi:hypothetical protein
MIIVGTPHTKGAGYTINDKDLASRQEADVRTCPQPACNNEACQDCIPFMRKIEAYIETQLRRVRLLR